MRGNCLFTILFLIFSLSTASVYAEDETLFIQEHMPNHEVLFIKKQKITEQKYLEVQGRMPNLQKESINGCRFSSDLIKKDFSKTIALTFDDGPSLEYNAEILRILNKYGVKATFFNIGKFAKTYPYLVLATRKSGHVVGNHSWSHPNFQTISPAHQELEILEGEKSQPEPLNSPKFFRYPYGASTCEGNDILHKNNYVIAGWTIDSCDWGYDITENNLTSKIAMSCGVLPEHTSDIEKHVLYNVRKQNGGIILFHETHKNTTEHLESIISKLQNEGYIFVNLNQLVLPKK